MKKTMMTQKYPKLINVGSLIRSVVGKKFPKLINVGCTFIRNARVVTSATLRISPGDAVVTLDDGFLPNAEMASPRLLARLLLRLVLPAVRSLLVMVTMDARLCI